jgi:hypothetical protein
MSLWFRQEAQALLCVSARRANLHVDAFFVEESAGSMAESLFTSAWDSFASADGKQGGQEGTWSVDIDIPPSFVMASGTLSMYQQHSANAYAYVGVHSYIASNELHMSQGYNGVCGAIAQPNVSRVTFTHGLGCGDGWGVLASFVLHAFIWD